MNLYHSLLQIVGLEPKDIVPVWSALIGAFVAIVAVYMQNRGSEKRHREDLAHAAKAAKETRDMDMRREIFMGVADALARQRDFISLQANLDIPDKELIEKVMTVAPAVFKFHLVATEASINCFMDAETLYSRVLADMVIGRTEVNREKGAVETLRYKRKLEQEIAQDLLAQIKEHARAEPPKAPVLMELLQKQFKESQDRNSAIGVEIDLASQQLARRNLELWTKGVEYARQYGAKLMPVLIEVRRELGVPLKAEELAVALEQNRLQNQKVLEDINARMAKMVG